MDMGTVGQSPMPLFVSTVSPHSAMMANRANGGTGFTGAVRTWVANLVNYCPMWLPFDYPVKRVFWWNGSTATSNADFGIYDDSGARIYNTGSTGQSGGTLPQYVTPASDFILPAGAYYFALTYSGTTSRGYSLSGSANASRLCGMLEETTGAFGLPATMTPVAFARAWAAPVCGVTRTTSGF